MPTLGIQYTQHAEEAYFAQLQSCDIEHFMRPNVLRLHVP